MLKHKLWPYTLRSKVRSQLRMWPQMFGSRDQNAVDQTQGRTFPRGPGCRDFSAHLLLSECIRQHARSKAERHRLPRHSQVKRVFPDPSSSCASVFEYLYTRFALTHKGSSLEPLQRFSSPSTEVKNRMTPLSPPPALDICFLKPTFDMMECVVIGS